MPAAIGMVALLVIFHDLSGKEPKLAETYGVIAGLAGGFLSFSSLELFRGRVDVRVPFRALSMIIGSPGAVFVLLFSPQAAPGYFFGAGVTFCFCWSAVELARFLAKVQKR